MNEQRNLLLAIVLSFVILMAFNVMFPPPAPPQAPQTQENLEGAQQAETPSTSTIPSPGAKAPAFVQNGVGKAARPKERASILKETARIAVLAPRLHGSISLVGGKVDDLTLADYRETTDPDSAEIILFSPKGAPDAHYAEHGWVATNSAVAVPSAGTLWTANRTELTPESPVTLSWDNGQGLVFKRDFSIDNNFMITVSQSVENATNAEVVLRPYGLISLHGTPPTTRFLILHEGLLGVFDGTLQEQDYDDLREDGTLEQSSVGGWLGITAKYWLSALVPDQSAKINARFVHHKNQGVDIYQADFLGEPMTIAPGNSGVTQSRLFAGAKEVALLDGYTQDLGISRFDLAVDFGWLYFLTKPIFHLLIIIREFTGNIGLAILALTVLIKLILFPMANKSYKSMSKMKLLQPKIQELREQFSDDKVRMNQEMMALYKREKANPAAGCLPILVQVPVFFALYKVLFVTIEMRQAPFYGWIHDLSVADPTSVLNLFGLLPFDPPYILGAWPLIMGLTMFLQQKLNPQPVDPVQAKVFMFLPVMFTLMLASFPAGLVIYWAWNNFLSIIQQWAIMRRMGAA
jgi:YidC/Oxa1 family membrane protein insertase